MDTKLNGIYAEGRNLCTGCAERIYGSSLEMYLNSGDVQEFSEDDRPTYTVKGLLCDNCWSWIFQPVRTANPWWLADPDPEEHLRLLAPFADFLETLQIDALNLRNIVPSRS